MCDYQAKLVAWLDRELPQDEAALVEAHFQTCAECRERVESYKEVGAVLESYCAAAASATVYSVSRGFGRRSAPVWVASASVAAAAIVLLILFFPHRDSPRPMAKPVPAPALQPSHIAAVPLKRVDVARAPVKRTHRRPAAPVALAESHASDWLPDEPPVRITIPADAMFPPGMLPEGTSFVADVSLAADGSARRLRLQPQLARFERRPNQQ